VDTIRYDTRNTSQGSVLGPLLLADRTNGRAIATLLRLSSVCL